MKKLVGLCIFLWSFHAYGGIFGDAWHAITHPKETYHKAKKAISGAADDVAHSDVVQEIVKSEAVQSAASAVSDVGAKVGKVATAIGKGITDVWDDAAMGALRSAFGSYSYQNQAASVRLPGQPKPSAYQAFEQNRKSRVKAKLQQNFGIVTNDDSMPKIGFCLSGGGFRAMLAGLGFLSGAEKIGLFDCAMYNAGLSGGTWALGPMSWMYLKNNMTVESYTQKMTESVNHGTYIKPGMTSPPFVTAPESNQVALNYLKRLAWKQTITSIDLWGALVGNLILQGVDGWDIGNGGSRLDITFSTLVDKVKEGNIPLPMLSMAHPFKSVAKNNVTGYRWFAMNPFEAGLADVGGYVPTWALGRKFAGGNSTSDFEGTSPEYPFSYWLGTCGSAFEFNLKFMKGNNLPSAKIGDLTIEIPKALVDTRFMPCQIDNYLQGVSGSKLSGKEFTLIDAGIDFNLPMPLLLAPEEQQSDIIFMFDSSATLFKPEGYNDMSLGEMTHKSVQLMLLNSYNEVMNRGVMPHFDPLAAYDMYQHGQVMRVFNDPRKGQFNPSLPVCIFMPLIKNPAYTKTMIVAGQETSDPEVIKNASNKDENFLSTFNFKYSKEQAQWLSGLTEANIVSMKDEIKDVMQAWVAKHPDSHHILL